MEKKIEEETGKNFGDPENPLLVSCRSGAKFSMPGMMDTVLNIGLNDKTAKGMIKLTDDERFVYDAYRRLITMYADVVMEKAAGITPKDEESGIRWQLEHVLERMKKRKDYKSDVDLTARDLKKLCSFSCKPMAWLARSSMIGTTSFED